MSEIETYKTWVVSTAHVTEKDDEILRQNLSSTRNPVFIVDNLPYGYRVYIQEDDFEEEEFVWERCGLSVACRKILKRGHQMRVKWVESFCSA